MIAQGFDRPGDVRVLSMAHAFSRSDRFVVGGFFDSHPGRVEEAERTWSVPPSPRDRRRWLDAGWDILYIATPDAQHGADLRAALASRPRAVLIEKPLSADPAEGVALLEEADRRGVVVMVNYPRRWHSATARLHHMAVNGDLPPPQSAIIAISGGLAHSFSHVVDFFHSVWGGGWAIEPVASGGLVRSLSWRRDSSAFVMAVIEYAAHYLWEIHVYTSLGKLELARSPEVLEWSVPAAHPYYPSYRVLRPALQADMEAEALLCGTVEALREAMEHSAAAARLRRREKESQQLLCAAIRSLSSHN